MKINFNNTDGKIKYMNAVNNGPVEPNVRVSTNNFEAYRAAGIPYARNHDASFYGGYGGEHTVDVHRIFKNFDADENDPESYIFEPTDKYVLNTFAAGTKVFYRFGASIEHNFKYGTYPPKDFDKWARICEHIIMHYTKGWANGYELDIEYWEIWNEPDCRNHDGSNPCWQGTEEEFIDLYRTSAKYLKQKFPYLKIGGPAFTGVWDNDNFVDKFLTAVKEENIPLDFFSFHWYGRNMSDLKETLDKAEKIMHSHGLDAAELILNEWNYVQGWREEEWVYTLNAEKSIKGASFIASAMSVCQDSKLDMLMYYDARPCKMNGMFDIDTLKPLKPYYTFIMFKELLELGTYVKPALSEEDIYSCGATNGSSHALMLSYYNNDDTYPEKNVRLDIEDLEEGLWDIEFYLLDGNNSCNTIRRETVNTTDFSLYINMSLFSTYLIKFTKRK